VIVVDRHIVVTVSYNFTAAAEHQNAENVTEIDSVDVAEQFFLETGSPGAFCRLNIRKRNDLDLDWLEHTLSTI
jgi:phosphatidylserine/phosphatidylglycerophosphate/cardiolipin synthase-like enzyme